MLQVTQKELQEQLEWSKKLVKAEEEGEVTFGDWVLKVTDIESVSAGPLLLFVLPYTTADGTQKTEENYM